MKNKVLISEWKLFYPIKKILFIVAECCLIYVGMGVAAFTLAGKHMFSGVSGLIFQIVLSIIFILLPILFFRPMIRYLKPFYRCFQGFPQRSIRKKMIQSVDKEEFKQVEDLKHHKELYKRVWISQNWFRIHHHYIPRNGVVAMNLEQKRFGSGGDYHIYLVIWILLLNGDYFCTGEVLGMASHMKSDDIRNPISSRHLLAQVLQEHTSGIMLLSKHTSEKLPLSLYLSIKKDFTPKFEQTSVTELFLQENELQKIVVQKMLDEWKDTLPVQKKYEPYSDFWKRERGAQRYIKEKWWKPEGIHPEKRVYRDKNNNLQMQDKNKKDKGKKL
jgi:hypothetical protein